MTRETSDSRFDVLFEPVQIGPVTAPNRFYQVPHCTGMGYARPRGLAAMREIKAEGGWGVVCTEYCSVHPSSEDEPMQTAALWNDDDIRALGLMVDGVHRHGSLAGVELWHGGSADHNGVTREEPLGPHSMPAATVDPVQSRRMDKRDIRDVRRWHVDAARRAVTAGFDIVYVYATHGYLLSQFLSPANKRADEYGGSLENRVRIVRELIEETKLAVGDAAAVAVRFSGDSGGPDGRPDSDEPKEMFALLESLPDLWDINISDYSYEQGVSRYVREAAFEDYVSWVKKATDKPVVSVGRFTSPDTILRQVTSGIMDLVGAARPSIADPFLPRKIREGRFDDIRECIGCNICAGWHRRGAPLRCTQNPSMGDEWRRGWHPERIRARQSERSLLVVGGGPAGMEAARALGQRGYPVTLTDARSALGGRVSDESALPGLSEWARVRDWRITQLRKLPNVEVLLDSQVDADQIREFAADRVVLATGAKWRTSGVGRASEVPIEGWQHEHVVTPDDLMAGRTIAGPVVVYDDDHYTMGGVIAEKLRLEGLEVTIVTPSGLVSAWCDNTEEQFRTQRRLIEIGVEIETSTRLSSVGPNSVTLACVYTGRTREREARSLVMVTSREPQDELYRQLADELEIARVGDCSAPSTIAAAVFAGHRYAQEMDTEPDRDNPTRVERPTILE